MYPPEGSAIRHRVRGQLPRFLGHVQKGIHIVDRTLIDGVKPEQLQFLDTANMIVSLVLRHGVYIRDGGRIRAIVLERDLRYMCADGLPERIAQKVRSTMVIADKSGNPVTAYRPTNTKLRCTKRLTKNLSHGV